MQLPRPAFVKTRRTFKSLARLEPLAERSLNRDWAVERLIVEAAAPVSGVLTSAAATVQLLRPRGWG
jgi:hypothetical protein